MHHSASDRKPLYSNDISLYFTALSHFYHIYKQCISPLLHVVCHHALNNVYRLLVFAHVCLADSRDNCRLGRISRLSQGCSISTGSKSEVSETVWKVSFPYSC